MEMPKYSSKSFEERIRKLCEQGNLVCEESSCETRKAKKFKKVPQILRENLLARDECFNPRMLFLGPFHKDNKDIPNEAKQLKSKAAKLFIANAGHEHCSQVFRWICENIHEFKKMYEEVGDEEDNEYAWMLFQDGCAASYFICERDTDDFKDHECLCAMMDVILLENQLPYQILERLTSSDPNAAGASGSTKICSYLKFMFQLFTEINDNEKEAKNNNDAGAAMSFNTTPPSPSPRPSPSPIAADDDDDILLPNLHTTTESGSGTQISIEVKEDNYLKEADDFVEASIINPQTLGIQEEQHHVAVPPGGYVHLLHHLRELLVGANDKSTTTAASELKDTCFSYTCRSAAQLRARGIHFKPSRSSHWIGVSFSEGWTRGYLHLSPICISDFTKAMLLNLAADEMSSDVPNDFAIASYLWFLDSLIDSSDDVKMLREANIIQNYLGSDEEVATIFNDIGKHLLCSNELYRGVKQKIQSHFDKKRKTWMAQLYHVYFGSPWTALALVGAILITYLTLLQTYLTMFPISGEDRTTEKKGLLYGLKHIYMLLALPLPLVVIILLLVSLFWFFKLLSPFFLKTYKVISSCMFAKVTASRLAIASYFH